MFEDEMAKGIVAHFHTRACGFCDDDAENVSWDCSFSSSFFFYIKADLEIGGKGEEERTSLTRGPDRS